MGTKKKRSFWKKFSCPWRLVYATRARVCGASAAHWTSARLPLRPACRSVPPAAPSSHTPPGKKYPSLIKSSTHFRPTLPTRAQEIPKLAVHKIGFRGTRQLLLYLRRDSTKINFAAIIIATLVVEVEVQEEL